MGVLVGGVTGLFIGYVAAAKAQEKLYLLGLGLLITGSYVGMILTGSIPALLALSVINGVGWAFFPILITVPFLLPGIRPRSMAVALSFVIMTTSLGSSIGPLTTGFLQEALDSLKLSLLIVSFASLSLCIAGLTLRYSAGTASPESAAVVPER